MIANTFTCSDNTTFHTETEALEHENSLLQKVSKYRDGVINGDNILAITSKGAFVEEEIPYEYNCTLHTIVLSDNMSDKLKAVSKFLGESK